MNRDVEASRMFLESERGSSGSGHPPSRSGPSSNIQDLIKCFCGVCETWFKRKSIEFALQSNGLEILRDQDARNILKKFVLYSKRGSNFRTTMEEIIECYELCQDILNGDKDLEENRADLDDFCYNEFWEDNLVKAIEDGTTDDFLHDLIRESAIRLEDDVEYSNFKEELRKKLRI